MPHTDPVLPVIWKVGAEVEASSGSNVQGDSACSRAPALRRSRENGAVFCLLSLGASQPCFHTTFSRSFRCCPNNSHVSAFPQIVERALFRLRVQREKLLPRLLSTHSPLQPPIKGGMKPYCLLKVVLGLERAFLVSSPQGFLMHKDPLVM